MIDLAAEMAKLPEPVTTEKPPHWAYWRYLLWTGAQILPAELFFTWPEIRHTMLQDHWPELVVREKNEMLRVSRKLPADAYDPNPSLYRNNIRQMYHLWKWEQVTGKKISDLESIVEIGGGYGAMAKMARRMGFRGEYTIFDLPEFSLLQQWYLERELVVGVEFITELPEKPHPSMGVQADLMIAIYSMSEMPKGLRTDILDTYYLGSFLSLYSGQWEAYDNTSWFEFTLRRYGFPNVFHEEQTHHFDKNNFYSIGW